MEKFDANFGNSTVTEQPLMQHSFSQIIDLYLYLLQGLETFLKRVALRTQNVKNNFDCMKIIGTFYFCNSYHSIFLCLMRDSKQG